MATITVNTCKDGSKTFSVTIRRKGLEICKTFKTEEDAKLYEFYKERLIDNMQNFDVPLKNRVSLVELFDLKMEETTPENIRGINDLEKTQERLLLYFDNKMFYEEISYADWLKFAEHLYTSDVYKGAKNDNGKRKMSLSTLLRIFRVISAVVSHAKSLGIPLENHPLKVIQSYIYPKKDK